MKIILLVILGVVILSGLIFDLPLGLFHNLEQGGLVILSGLFGSLFLNILNLSCTKKRDPLNTKGLDLEILKEEKEQLSQKIKTLEKALEEALK